MVVAELEFNVIQKRVVTGGRHKIVRKIEACKNND